MGDQGSAKST